MSGNTAAVLLSGSGGGFPYHQFGVEQDGADGDPVHQAAQRIITAFPELDPILPHCGQGRICVSAAREVVETEGADIRAADIG